MEAKNTTAARSGRRSKAPTSTCAVLVPAAVEDLKIRSPAIPRSEVQLIEKYFREDLKPCEQAHAFDEYMKSHGLTQRQFAERFRISQPSVARAIALLRLSPEIQRLVDAGEIAPTTAYHLGRIKDPAERSELAREAAAGRLRTDQAHWRVGAAKGNPAKGSGGRLPAEMKYRAANGVRLVARTAARHSVADVVAGLREMADRLEADVVRCLPSPHSPRT